MFNQVIAGAPTLPQQLSSDHDPLFEFHRWNANLRILDVSEIKTVPHVPLSHPFVERLIGTVRRELLDYVPFWGARDLERKLRHFRDYYNHGRVHASLKGITPVCSTDRNVIALDDYAGDLTAAGCISSLRPREAQFATDRSWIMNTKHIEDLRKNVVLRKRLAKYMALQCFRNTELENLHAGKFPSSQSDDYSDVKVISPYGEIPWNDLSRISDEEMKVLMIDVVNHCDRFLAILFTTSAGDAVIEELKTRDMVPNWNDPE